MLEPRQHCPGLPQRTTPCPHCHSTGGWVREPQVGGAYELGCLHCGTIVADWEPGLPDWVLRPRFAPPLVAPQAA